MTARYDQRLVRRKAAGKKVMVQTTRQVQELKAQGLKLCPKCQRVLPLDQYSTMKVRTGIAPYCRDCANDIAQVRSQKPETKAERADYYQKRKRVLRNARLMRGFGITLDEYENKLKAQDGKCAICECTVEANGKALAVDHNHTTGAVRELLCGNCNAAIGFIQDSPERARAMGMYLDKHSGVK